MLAHIRRSLFHFEMPGDPAAMPPGAEPVVEAPAEPAWAGPSQEEWGQVTQGLGYLLSQMQGSQEPEGQPQQPQADYSSFDPWNDQFPQQLGSRFDRLEQMIQQQQEWVYGQQLGEAEERALDIIDDDVSRNGEFMLGDKAYDAVQAIAARYVGEYSQQYGYGPKAAEAAIARAASEWREYEKQLATSAVERHMNQLTSLSGAGREPLGAVVGTSSGSRVPAGGDELSVVTAYGGTVPGR